MKTAHQSITFDIPTPEYERFEQLAVREQSAVPYLVRKLALSKLPEVESIPADVQSLLDKMETMSDEELWVLRDIVFTPAQDARSEELREIWNTRPLTSTEARESQLLSDVSATNTLISSKAILILVQRGHDLNECLHTPQIA